MQLKSNSVPKSKSSATTIRAMSHRWYTQMIGQTGFELSLKEHAPPNFFQRPRSQSSQSGAKSLQVREFWMKRLTVKKSSNQLVTKLHTKNQHYFPQLELTPLRPRCSGLFQSYEIIIGFCSHVWNHSP